MPRLLYFAGIREQIGKGEEDIHLPASVETGNDLVAWLAARQPEIAAALQMSRLRMALDQEIVPLSAKLGAAREIALFPPMTGG